MKRNLKLRFGAAAFIACSIGAMTLQAMAAQGDLTADLKAWKIVKKDGKETRVPSDKLGVGEILEYQATYKNNSSKTLSGIQATLPIPQGLELLPGSFTPVGAKASTDGKTFGAVPLRRTVKVNGVSKEVSIPYSEYRFLRWTVSSLKSKQSVTVSARTKLAR